MKGIFEKVISVFFGLLMLAILYATVILDKSVASIFPNTVKWPNFVYYLIALAIFTLIVVLVKKKKLNTNINTKIYVAIMVIVPLVVLFTWQLPISKWIYYFTNEGDFGCLYKVAVGFNQGETFQDYPYFFRSPNNANLAILLSYIYKILPSWRKIIFLGAIITNLIAVITALTINNITNNRLVSVISLIVTELLVAMTWRAFIVYTDYYGMLFITLMIWAYTLKADDRLKIILISLFAACGTFVKATVFCIYLAIAIHWLFTQFKSSKKLIVPAVVALVFWISMVGVQTTLRSHYKLDLSDAYPKTWQYMFFVGQNANVYGVANHADNVTRDDIVDIATTIGKDNSYVKSEILRLALERVNRRGVVGNFQFYLCKLNVAYNDGYFHNVQSSSLTNVTNELEHNIYYDLLENTNGKYYQISASILQVIWDGVLLLLAVGAVYNGKSKLTLYQMAILGITLYLMLFEGRSKYIYMFLPIYIHCAMISLANLLVITKKRLSRPKN